MPKNDYIEKITQNLEHLTKDELKDVATLTNDQFEVRLKVAEKEYWGKEIANLKSQLQQQALPVVPEYVGEWIECVKGKNNNALALLDDDNMPDDVNEWLFFQRNDDNINLILRAWLDGYTVEKPQLFYLKHIDMSKRNSINDLYLKKYIHADLTETGEHRLSHVMSAKGMYPPKDYCAFTQQEIDSMETGSYEQIEVVE